MKAAPFRWGCFLYVAWNNYPSALLIISLNSGYYSFSFYRTVRKYDLYMPVAAITAAAFFFDDLSQQTLRRFDIRAVFLVAEHRNKLSVRRNYRACCKLWNLRYRYIAQISKWRQAEYICISQLIDRLVYGIKRYCNNFVYTSD